MYYVIGAINAVRHIRAILSLTDECGTLHLLNAARHIRAVQILMGKDECCAVYKTVSVPVGRSYSK